MSGLIWIGHRGLDADIFASVAPVRALICCDWDADLCALSDKVSVSSVERVSRRRSIWSSASLSSVNQETLRTTFRQLSADEWIDVVPYRSTVAVEDVVSSFPRARLAAARANVVERLDDKRVQRQLFEALGLTTPRWSIVRSDNLAKGALLGKVGLPAVIQVPRGSLGIGTFLAESMEDLQRLNARARGELVVSEYLPGPSVNATAVVGRRDVHLAWPSIQLVGLPSCIGGADPFRYCGNDFGATAHLPPKAIHDLFAFIRILGAGLRTVGFLGLFGTDWIFNDGRWYLLELNPRFQGSTLLLSARELAAGGVPLAVEHVRAFFGESAIITAGRRSTTPEPVTGGQVVLYQRHRDWVTVGGSVSAFPVRKNDDELQWRPVGAPTPGTEVAPGAVVARLCTAGSVLDSSLGELTSNAKEAIRLAYHALDPVVLEYDEANLC